MINKISNNQCKMINIVWIERGILLTLIYLIIKKYDILKKKKIILNNKRYIILLKYFFPDLKFDIFKKHKSKNFYFNIRNIIKKQDIIIDYINNYDDIINTKKISLIPWFDLNDILILYEYDENEKLHIKKYIKFIKNFSYFKRCNYHNVLWDIYVENHIFKKYSKIKKNINLYINYFNNFIKSNYTNTVIEIPKIYYVDRFINQIQEPNKNLNPEIIESETKMNELIDLINEKFNIINKII